MAGRTGPQWGPPGAQGAACDYRPRLSAECGDLRLTLGGGGGAPPGAGRGGDGAGAGVAVALQAWQLEAVEHLPVGPAETAASELALDQVRSSFSRSRERPNAVLEGRPACGSLGLASRVRLCDAVSGGAAAGPAVSAAVVGTRAPLAEPP